MSKLFKLVLFSGCVLFSTICWAAPGDLIGNNIYLPVPGFGVSVAADCDGEIYYTNNGQLNLYVIDANGALLNTLPTVNAAGDRLDIDEMAWDASRQILWGQLHGSNPIEVYTINATTGVATHAFTSITNSLGTFRDGIAYDPSDDTLWITGDVSTTIEHYTTGGVFINQITPKNAAGETLGTISGIVVGAGDLLYLGRNGLVEVDQVQKSDGAFISTFASPGGARDEGLECDAASYFPLLTLWSRDVGPPGFLSAIEIEPGSCECGVVTCTLGYWKNHPEEWVELDPDDEPVWGDGATYMDIFNTPPKKGDASVMLAHAYIAAVLNTGANPSDVADAMAMLAAHPIGSGDLKAGKNADPDRAVALAIMEDLQYFNESAECTL